VAVYAEHKREIAVVLTDMTMPILDGPATVRTLVKLNPAIKIIGVSGLNIYGGVTAVAEANVKRFMTKPYTARALLLTIRAVLDAP
jgi:CheY-like chemotaxis protein